MPLTGEQLARFRLDVGDTLRRSAFSNDVNTDISANDGGGWNQAV